MASKEPILNPQDKKDIAKYAAYGIGATVLVNWAYRKFFGGPGSVRRFKPNEIDYDKTQKRCIVINSVTGELYCEPDPWGPEELADELQTAMSGVSGISYGETDRSVVWEKLKRQGIHRVRLLHNYWLDNVDNEDTLYRWLLGERVLRWSQEEEERDAAKSMLRRAGAGF